MEHVEIAGLRVARVLAGFVAHEAAPGTGVAPDAFWRGFAAMLAELTPRLRALLDRRDALQAELDGWHAAHARQPHDPAAYAAFLREIGYVQAEPGPFEVSTRNVDDEIAHIAGPQLVVPVSNARYALNAANARWGSLYDALYGTDALAPPTAARGYDAARGAQVVARAKQALDEIAPLAAGSHADAKGYAVTGGALSPALAHPEQLVGFLGDAAAPTAVLLRHNGLHAEIRIDRAHPIGRTGREGLRTNTFRGPSRRLLLKIDSMRAIDSRRDPLVSMTSKFRTRRSPIRVDA